MNDHQVVQSIINGDSSSIHDFFFVRCYGIFTYVGQYFCDGMQAEEIIGEAYIVLSADDWHKLRVFEYSCSLVTYVSVIVARHFQHKRDRLMKVDDNLLIKIAGRGENVSTGKFLMDDIKTNLKKFNSLDQFLISRILLEGDKPRDIIDEIKPFLIDVEGETFVNSHSKEQLFGYIYTRYSRVKSKFQQYMKADGYGR